MNTLRSGGQLLVDALVDQGVQRVFCVPGESYLPVLDALHDTDIDIIVCKQEGGAAMMAEATGKIDGRPGICFVTRGPGASNAVAGVHIAAQDSTPMILFVGQIDSAVREREAFQEVNYRQFFGGMVKWVAEIDSADRVSELVARAWRVALSGRPGPVVLALPEDMLIQTAPAITLPPIASTECAPTADQLDALDDLLDRADNPIMILGGSRWSADSLPAIRRFAESRDLPVAVTFRRQMLFDHEHPLYAGDIGLGINPALRQRVLNADLVVMVGARLSEIASQDYTLLEIPVPRQTLIHVHPGAEEIGRVYQPALAMQCSPTAFAAAVAARLDAQAQAEGDATPIAPSEHAAHTNYLDWSSLNHAHPDAALMRDIMAHLQSSVPADTVICNGAGNYAGWIHRFWRFRQINTQIAPTSGSMGYGLPAAIAGKLAMPERTVIAFAGDGCFQMSCQEMATAAEYGAAVIVLVIDNGMYGTIRMHQERRYPGRVSGTSMRNPDFARLARAYDAYGATVRTLDEFKLALSEAIDSQRLSLLHIHVDPNIITPTQSLLD